MDSRETMEAQMWLIGTIIAKGVHFPWSILRISCTKFRAENLVAVLTGSPFRRFHCAFFDEAMGHHGTVWKYLILMPYENAVFRVHKSNQITAMFSHFWTSHSNIWNPYHINGHKTQWWKYFVSFNLSNN